MTIDVKNAKGAMENWQGEGPSPSWFRIRDVGKADFENSIGKSFDLELSRARDKSLIRPDPDDHAAGWPRRLRVSAELLN